MRPYISDKIVEETAREGQEQQDRCQMCSGYHMIGRCETRVADPPFAKCFWKDWTDRQVREGVLE